MARLIRLVALVNVVVNSQEIPAGATFEAPLLEAAKLLYKRRARFAKAAQASVAVPLQVRKTVRKRAPAASSQTKYRRKDLVAKG